MSENQLDAAIADRHRLKFLDGLRGLAILMVMLFHAYVRWPELVPYGHRYEQVPLFSYGWLGVDLFFLISGFVIFMTLEKCSSFRDFISRRWLRLFPAMLICSLLVFFTLGLFPERPAGAAVWRDMLPGLSFIEPSWWGLVLRSPQGLLEGAFWSLFVEVKFYFIAGLLYFFIGGRKMIVVLALLFLSAAAVSKLQHMHPAATALYWPGLLLAASSAGQFGWFAAGALYYRYFHERKKSLFGAALLIALAAAIVTGGLRPGQSLAAGLIVVFFTAAICWPYLQALLSRPLLIFMGFISYPLYLLHENMMVAMIVKMGRFAPWMPDLLMPLLPILVVIGAGSLIALYVEPWVQKRLKPHYQNVRRAIGVATPLRRA